MEVIMSIKYLHNAPINNQERRRQLHCPVLVTERLVLRPPHVEDMDAITDLANNRHVSAMLNSMSYPYTRKQAADFILRAVSGEMGHCVYAITLSETGEFIGICSIKEHENDDNGVVIGYWLGEPFWNKGYASEAVHTVIDTVFRATDLEKIYVNCFAANRRSQKVIEKFGFVYDGVTELQSLVSGLVLTYCFHLSRENWLESHTRHYGRAIKARQQSVA